jgi:hypothetical protein
MLNKWQLPALFMALWLGLGAPIDAQTVSNEIAIGGGSLLGEEDFTFERDSLFAAVHWSGIDLPLNASTGIGIEFYFPELSGWQPVYKLWSLNRLDISDGFYSGADMRISNETDPDFDVRIVVGVRLVPFESGGNLFMEFYTLEDDRPIAFAVLYRF